MQRGSMADSDDDADVIGEDVAMPPLKIFSCYNFLRGDDDTPGIQYAGRQKLPEIDLSCCKVDSNGFAVLEDNASSVDVVFSFKDEPCLPSSIPSLERMASPGLINANFALSSFGVASLPRTAMQCMAKETIPCVNSAGQVVARRRARYFVSVTNARSASNSRGSRKRTSQGSPVSKTYDTLDYYVVEFYVRYLITDDNATKSEAKLLASIKFRPCQSVSIASNDVSSDDLRQCSACHLLRERAEYSNNQYNKSDSRKCKECQENEKLVSKPLAAQNSQYTATLRRAIKEYAPATPSKCKAVVVVRSTYNTTFQVSKVPNLQMHDNKSTDLDLYQSVDIMEWLVSIAQAVSTTIDLQDVKEKARNKYNADLAKWRRSSNDSDFPAFPVNYGRVREEDFTFSHFVHLIAFNQSTFDDRIDDRSHGSVTIDNSNINIHDVFGLDGRRLYITKSGDVCEHKRLWSNDDDVVANHGAERTDETIADRIGQESLANVLKMELSAQSVQLAKSCVGSDLAQKDIDEYKRRDSRYLFLLEQAKTCRVIGSFDIFEGATSVPKGKGEYRKAMQELKLKRKTALAQCVADAKVKLHDRFTAPGFSDEVEGSTTHLLTYHLRRLKRFIDKNSTACNELSRLVLDGALVGIGDENYTYEPSSHLCANPFLQVRCAHCQQKIANVRDKSTLQVALSQASPVHLIFECKKISASTKLFLNNLLDNCDVGSFADLHELALGLHDALVVQFTSVMDLIDENVDLAFTRSVELEACSSRSIRSRYKRRGPRKDTNALVDSSMTSLEFSADQHLRRRWKQIKLVDTESPDDDTKLECFKDADAKHFWQDRDCKLFYIGELVDNTIFVVADWLPVSPKFKEKLDLSSLPKNEWHSIPGPLRDELVYSTEDFAKVNDVFAREVCKAGRQNLFRVRFSEEWIEIHTLETFQKLPKASLRTNAARRNMFDQLIESMRSAGLDDNPILVPNELGMNCESEDGDETTTSSPVLISAIGKLDCYKLRNAHMEVEHATLQMLKESIQPLNHPDIRHFFRDLKASDEGDWIPIPKGSRGNQQFSSDRDAEDNLGTVDGAPLLYRYRSSSNRCAFGAAANVLAAAGDLEGGEKLWAAAAMDVSELRSTLRISDKKFPGRYDLVVAYLRQELKYIVQKLSSDYDALAPSESAKIVEVVGSNGRCEHVVGIIGSTVFDGNRGHEMQLSKAALDWCAGSSGEENSVTFDKAMGYSIVPSKKTWKAISRKDPESFFGSMQLHY